MRQLKIVAAVVAVLTVIWIMFLCRDEVSEFSVASGYARRTIKIMSLPVSVKTIPTPISRVVDRRESDGGWRVTGIIKHRIFYTEVNCMEWSRIETRINTKIKEWDDQGMSLQEQQDSARKFLDKL